MSAAELAQRLEQALALCRSGALDEAEDVYRELTNACPDAPDPWNMLAAVLYQRGALDEAAHCAAQATALRPAIAPYWLMHGNIALARKAHAQAQASFERAIAIEPAFAEAHYRLGLALHADHRYSDATRAYRAALSYAPDVAEIHWQLADALIAEGLLADAMREYQEAFSRDANGVLDRRPAFEWLGRLHFEALPAFWRGELERFFSGSSDVDVKPYVRAGLKSLKTQSAFRTVLERASEEAPLRLDAATQHALKDRLLHALLRECLIADPQFERWLTRIRAALLLEPSLLRSVPFEFLCAFALQNFNNEFVFFESQRERAALAPLRAAVEEMLTRDAGLSEDVWRMLLTLACYRRLESVSGIDRALHEAAARPLLQRLLTQSVLDARTERALRETIAPIAPSDDAVSREVRGMYEEHPYPRWFTIDREPPVTLSDWLARDLPAAPPVAAAPSPRVLVAGCGTGRDAIWIAANVAGARVLAVDLSLSSLAYARRMAGKLGVGNVEFRHGDILGLPRLDERFDFIASTGVLHHMREPMAGLRAIAGLLRPGGLMKLGFYSARARVAVSAARNIIAAENIASTEEAIRAFRQRVFAEPPDSRLKELEHSNDFYSMSMCRDLLFHVQEHQYTLPELGAMLDAVDLELLGLAELPQDALARYRRAFPNDARMTDVASWDAFEQAHPETFSLMFLLWCRRRDSFSA